MPADLDVLAVGELNPDLILARIDGEAPRLGTEQRVGEFVTTLGSSTAICTVGMARLGLRAAFVARLGADDHGRFCLAALEREGIDTRHILVDPASRTGVTVSLTYPSDRFLATFPGSMAELTAEAVPDGVLERARHLHIASVFLQDALRPGLAGLLARARSLGLSTSLDTGWDPAERWTDDTLLAALPHLDLLLPNRAELAALSGCSDPEAGAAWALENGVGAVVLKCGSHGAALFTPGERHRHPGYPAEVLDSTGAGDSFDAGFLFGFLRGWSSERSLAFGNACGALAVAAIGGTGGFGSFAEVAVFLAAHGDGAVATG